MEDSIVVQAQTTAIASGNSGWQVIGSSGGNMGVPTNCRFQVNQVNGNPDVLFKIQVSPDQIRVFDLTFDELGPVNTNIERVLTFLTQYANWRLAWVFNAVDPGEGAGNSSSLSGQSFNSSSSGGGNSIAFRAGVVASYSGL